MSSHELPARPADDETVETETGRPSVTITRNAKGQAQWVVKVYGLDASELSALAAARLAQHIYDELTAKYGSGS